MIEYAIKAVGVLFAIELILGGSGLWSNYIGFPVRKILFALLAGLFVFRWLNSEKSNKKMDFLFLLGTTCLIVWAGLIPLIYGIPTIYAIRDSLPFFGLLIIFIAYDFFENKPRTWESFSNIIYWFTLTIGLIHITIYSISLIDISSALLVTGIFISLLDPSVGEGDGSTSVMIGLMPDGSFRVMWISSVFLLLCLYLSLKKLEDGKIKVGAAGLLVSILSIYATGTRGFILGILVGLSQTFFLYIIYKTFKPGTRVIIFFGVSLLFFNAILLLPLYSPDFLSMIGAARDESDQLRYEQIQSLFEAFMNHPLIGNGFGASANIIRSIESPFSYELAILALYMKIGIIGIVLAGLIVYQFTCNIFCSRKVKPSVLRISQLFIFSSTFIVASTTNPYLSNFVGLGIILFIYYEFMATCSTLNSANS